MPRKPRPFIPPGDLGEYLKDHPHLKVKASIGPIDVTVCGDVKPKTLEAIAEMAGAVAKEYPKGYVPYEHDEQVEFVDWLKKREIRHFAVPNGGGRSRWQSNQLKGEGVSAGVPDVVIPYARGPYHHGYCEMKRVKGGTVSKDQRIWIDFLVGQGCYVWVAKGAQEAIDGFVRYWDLGPFDPDAPK